MPGRGADPLPDKARKPKVGEPMQASCADAGFSNVRFHAVYYVPGQYGYWAAYCGTGADGVTLMSNDTRPAARIRPEHRCKRPGCQRAFAIADKEI